MISVAMLTYNRGKTVAKSIASVAKDPSVSQVWVFDDVSTEGEFKYIKEACDAFPQKITLKQNSVNKGYAHNLIQAIKTLQHSTDPYLFLCESDMLLVDGWGAYIEDVFELLENTVCIAPMLHTDQLIPNRSESFKNRVESGVYETGEDGSVVEIKKPFGKCFDEYPDNQKIQSYGKFKLRFVANSIGTMVFRSKLLMKIDIEKVIDYPVQEDAWLSWNCFVHHEYHPESIAVLDPGLALTFGDPGLHGNMILMNQKWAGSFLWRYVITSAITKFVYRGYFYILRRLKEN
jgi:GT2 family glycosyltransferase